MKKSQFISAFAAIIALSGSAAYAQDGLMAFQDENRKQLESVDSEIHDAMKALNEAAEVIEESAKTEKVTVDELIDSAETVASSNSPAPEALEPKPDKSTDTAISPDPQETQPTPVIATVNAVIDQNIEKIESLDAKADDIPAETVSQDKDVSENSEKVAVIDKSAESKAESIPEETQPTSTESLANTQAAQSTIESIEVESPETHVKSADSEAAADNSNPEIANASADAPTDEIQDAHEKPDVIPENNVIAAEVQNSTDIAPKLDIQTAPEKTEVIPENTVIAAEVQNSTDIAPKLDIDTVPEKTEVIPENTVIAAEVQNSTDIAPKHNIDTVSEKTEVIPENTVIAAKVQNSTDIAPKHDIQTAPEKTEVIPENTMIAAKVQNKADIAPKHNLQKAPEKNSVTIKSSSAKAETQVTAKSSKQDLSSASAKSSSSAHKAVAVASKHNVQTAPSKSFVQTTSKSQAGQKSPALHPKKNSSSLSMDYVMANYRANDVNLGKAGSNGQKPTIGQLYQYAFSQKLVYHRVTPAVGDLVFFHNTLDRNGDNQWNDWHTLVGIVEAVNIDGNQTISVLTWRTDKIERIHLNLKYPELSKSRKGKILNSQLRANQDENKGTAAKLFAGFANLLGDKTSFNLIDNWKPGMK